MRATEQSKADAFKAGYQFFIDSGFDYLAARKDNSATRGYFPAEAWSWVRGFEQACNDARSGKLTQ